MLNNQVTTLFPLVSNTFISFVAYLAVLVGLLLSFQVWKIKKNKSELETFSLTTTFYFMIQSIQKPIFVLILLYIGYILLELGNYLFHSRLVSAAWIFQLSISLLKIGEYITYFWLVLSAYHTASIHLLNWLVETKKQATFVILSTLSQSLYTAIILLMVTFLIPLLGVTGVQEELLEKIAKLLLIGMVGWIFIQIVNGIEKLILHHIDIANNNGIKVRAINTQVLLLKKIIQAIIILVTLAAGLMTFESVRNLGTGLLTTAGVLGAIGAFASQQSLSRLFTGLQLAFSQPIRIGDTVIIENENGQIEEITLSYVVVKLWDLRRLILPTDYFFSKGLQNLTRNSTELLGTIFIYADYTLPIDIIRDKFFEYTKNSKLWNKNVATFQVTDIKEHTMELRGLVSANDGIALWNLRCEVREALIKFIVNNYPTALPTKRNIMVSQLEAPLEQTSSGSKDQLQIT